MAEVPKVGDEIDGCQVQTTFVKRTYVFGWSVKNFPPYRSLFEVRSPEFRPVSDRLFYATVERKYDNACGHHDVILSIFLKEGLPIGIKHTISITNCTGKILKSISGSHKHSLVSECHPALSAFIIRDRDKFETEDYPCINFKCTMKFDESSTDIVHSHPKPSPSENMQNLVDDLKAMYTSFDCADLCLKVEECSPLFAHKAILSCRSPVFAKMLKSPMDEKEKDVIVIKDIKLPIVEGLMEFLHTGVLCNEDFDFVYDLYYAAGKYDVSSLRKTCTNVLLAKLDVENSCRAFGLANRHSDIQFKDAVMEFIQFHFDDILQTKNWSEFLDEETKLAAEVMRCRSLKSKKVSNNVPVA
ncbi:hypothetical protein JTE90_020690 [Oedothorax gibbosus]|uniref:BTB domain-containing protein n=1 Tax=Oedothorax gibbosus TaxID=931172 RepID=A0AAV6V5U3_9ARAC|nr:hypothetical protein JTE90_020690 [Oedothorax gibbosus]